MINRWIVVHDKNSAKVLSRLCQGKQRRHIKFSREDRYKCICGFCVESNFS